MKSIIVDINQNELDELGILDDHISIGELKKRILAQLLRKQRDSLEKLNEQYGFNKLSEEEILNIVNESLAEYNNEKNGANT